MEMVKILAHLALAIVITSYVIKARLLRDRRTVGSLQEEESRSTRPHRHRHQHDQSTFAYRDFTNGDANEDPNAPATTRVIARLRGYDLTPIDSRDGDDDTNRQEEHGSTDHSTRQMEGSGFTDSTNSTNATYMGQSNCTQCMIREEMKRIKIEAIKSQILSKLRLKSIPNVTAWRIPSIPLIQDIMEKYEMQRDAPYLGDSYFGGIGEPDHTDDYHAKTMKVVNFATPGTYC